MRNKPRFTATGNKCPACGQPLPNIELPMVDLTNNTITFGGLSTKVTPKEAEFFYIIRQKYPNMVPHLDIIDGLYGHFVGDEEKKYRYIISVYAMKVRNVLKPLGWDIIATFKEGYSLGRFSYVATTVYTKKK